MTFVGSVCDYCHLLTVFLTLDAGLCFSCPEGRKKGIKEAIVTFVTLGERVWGGIGRSRECEIQLRIFLIQSTSFFLFFFFASITHSK